MKIILAIALSLFMSSASFAQEIVKEKPSNPVLLMKTNFGDLYIEMFPEEAPQDGGELHGPCHGQARFR